MAVFPNGRYHRSLSDYNDKMESRVLATGNDEARLLANLERHGVVVFDERRHARLAPKGDPRLRRYLVARLARKGWLARVERGKYVVVPRAAVGRWAEHPFVVAH